MTRLILITRSKKQRPRKLRRLWDRAHGAIWPEVDLCRSAYEGRPGPSPAAVFAHSRWRLRQLLGASCLPTRSQDKSASPARAGSRPSGEAARWLGRNFAPRKHKCPAGNRDRKRYPGHFDRSDCHWHRLSDLLLVPAGHWCAKTILVPFPAVAVQPERRLATRSHRQEARRKEAAKRRIPEMSAR